MTAGRQREQLMGPYPAGLFDCEPRKLGAMYRLQTFCRGRLYGWEPLSSTRYRGLRTKDDGYLLFQMYIKRCVVAP